MDVFNLLYLISRIWIHFYHRMIFYTFDIYNVSVIIISFVSILIDNDNASG